jgi:hypothetical protein
MEMIRLDPDPLKGTFWPDAIGCGSGFMGLYVSTGVKRVLDEERIRYGRGFPAQVQTPYPKKLLSQAPTYHYLTGEAGAKLNFEACGFGIRSICSMCGFVSTTADSEPSKFEFIEDTWNGSDLFFTDYSHAIMFCTKRILELARKHKWTNFRFVPLADAFDFGHKGIAYP